MLSDLTRILAENKNEMLKLIAPAVKKSADLQNLEDSDSEAENAFPTTTLTPIKSETTTSKITLITSRNSVNPAKSFKRNRDCFFFSADTFRKRSEKSTNWAVLKYAQHSTSSKYTM